MCDRDEPEPGGEPRVAFEGRVFRSLIGPKFTFIENLRSEFTNFGVKAMGVGEKQA